MIVCIQYIYVSSVHVVRVAIFLSDVYTLYGLCLPQAYIRSTYCACAMVVGAGVGVVIEVHVVHMQFL